MGTNVTVVLRNRYRLTCQTLESLADSNNKELMRVTILDDRSDSPTRDFVKSWCDRFGADYIRNDIPMGTASLRNVVIQEASKYREQHLALCDNDLFFMPGWLDVIVAALAAVSPSFLSIGGVGHPFHIPIETYPVDGTHCIKEVLALPLQSWFLKWETMNWLGPFRNTPVDAVCQGEDVDMGNKIREAGFKLGVVSPALMVNCGITNSFGEKIPGYEMVKAECPEGIICE